MAITLSAIPKPDLGYVEVRLSGQMYNEYTISRGPTELYKKSNTPSEVVIKDILIPYGYETGLNGTGVLQNYIAVSSVYSANMVLPGPFYFEDSFLMDKDHILPIKYNPQVSSFKRTIQEAKLETLGNQYPFIVRNGALDYAEFQIGGLLSATASSIGFGVPAAAANLAPETFKIERDFKMNVLSWLNDGKPKLFKSPTEGEFLVYLMGVSLTPWENPLGRLLHTFTANAVEIGPATPESLARNNIYDAGTLFS